MVSAFHLQPDVTKIPHIDALLIYLNRSFPVKVLIDSGACENCISSLCLVHLNIPRHRNVSSYQISNIQGKPLGKGLVHHHTPDVTLRIGCLHMECISLLLLEEATANIVMWRPWLAQHHPDIHWTSGEVLKLSKSCLRRSITAFPTSKQTSSDADICSTTIKSSAFPCSFQIPAAYQAFQDMFSEAAATQLPPHRLWDCNIDLLPGAKQPKGHVYPLSIPERAAMEEYIYEALQRGFIHSSTSPAASSFFFGAKNDGGLRPCIDYRSLNSQTIKFIYPLPLVPAALEELRGARNLILLPKALSPSSLPQCLCVWSNGP